ncbi:HEAT repeat domain-containing protein [Spirillospora sp. NPDC029432]|uniref:HEAT repeat domain-containing protein n=1 Tax=Spirillospora sp. NPDC029432 TaxID=3154599 RepID=UPI003454C70B
MSRSHDRFATRRRVLRPETTVEHVDEFAKGFQWPMVSVTERDREAGTDGEVVWQADGHTLGKRTLKTGSLRYVQDAMFGIGYIFFTGDPQNVAETLASTADQTLRPWTVQDLCQALDQAADPRSRGRAVLRLGLAAPGKPDQQVSQRIGAALRDGDARVRYASVFATSYTGYRDLLPHLRAIAERDAEEFLRERATSVLRAMDGVKV